VTARRQSAMTLLEVVLAIALSVGVMGAAMAFYRQAVEVRGGLEGRMRDVESQRLVMDRITNELRGAMTYPFLQMGMEGQPGEVQFIVAHLPGPAAWAIRKSTEDPIQPESDLEMVGYRLRIEEDDDGQEVVAGLERTSQKVLTVREVDEEEDLESVLVSSEVKFLALRYYHEGVWLTSWSSDVPRAVEITLGASPLPDDTQPQDYPYETFRRVVHLPAAPLPQQRGGTVVRGRGRRS